MQMEPLSRTRLLSMRADLIAAAKIGSVRQIVHQIYQHVMEKSRTLETRHVYILERFNLGRIGLTDSAGKEIIITIDDIRDLLIEELKRMFPDCKIKYIEKTPSEDIFAPVPRRAPGLEQGEDGKNRAIVIDWSMDA